VIFEYVWSNVQQMQSTSQPIEGAPKRDFMPQTDDIDWMAPLKAGIIDINEPHGKHKEESTDKGTVLERWQRLAGLIRD
jgi:hypothetical protein